MVFMIFLLIKSFHLFYIIFISESIISLCHQLSWTTFWMPWVIKTYHTHTPDRLCRYSPPWCVLSVSAYYLCFLVQILVPAYYTHVRTIPREIRYNLVIIIKIPRYNICSFKKYLPCPPNRCHYLDYWSASAVFSLVSFQNVCVLSE